MATGYFDTFSMVFGWWHAEPAFYRYRNLGTFYIERSRSYTHYIERSRSYTHYIARSHTKNYYVGSEDL
jgi:hypothetical protein